MSVDPPRSGGQTEKVEAFGDKNLDESYHQACNEVDLMPEATTDC